VADVGARLRASREAKRLSLEAVAASTRVHSRILSAIERNDPSVLPPRPYGRGFVRAYARELGLNADDVVREYFGQFAPPEPPPAPPPPERPPTVLELQPLLDRLPLGRIMVAAVAVLLVAGSWMLAHRTGRSPAPSQDAVGTSGHATAQSSPTQASQAQASPAPAVKPAGTATPSGAPLTVVLNAAAPCWVTATADGKRVLYRALQPGERASLEGTRTISIRAGNSGALTWTVNGRAMGTFGSSGEVRTMRVTPDSTELLESSAQN
jgi:cytoskeletal protein RodZ